MANFGQHNFYKPSNRQLSAALVEFCAGIFPFCPFSLVQLWFERITHLQPISRLHIINCMSNQVMDTLNVIDRLNKFRALRWFADISIGLQYCLLDYDVQSNLFNWIMLCVPCDWMYRWIYMYELIKLDLGLTLNLLFLFIPQIYVLNSFLDFKLSAS